MEWLKLDLPDADLRIAPGFLDPDAANRLFEHLLQEIRWETHCLRLFGRVVEAPRRSSWIGDPGAHYRYSGSTFAPHPWLVPLRELCARIEQISGRRFNSVLANLYRDGQDVMGWHADDEPELGLQPTIASVSLGGERVVRFRRGRGGPSQGWSLPNGSLLLMAGDTQIYYQHSLPRTGKPVGARINLTFRWVAPAR